MRTLAKLAEQLPIILEEQPENFRHAENILPVGNRIEDIRLEVRTELYHLLGVTGGAEPATPATESQQVFMMAIGATHTSEPLVQITTLKVFTNNPGNYSAEKAKLLD